MQTFRKGLRVAVLVSCAVLLAGCLVTSLRPLHDEEYPPVFDNSLLGRWIDAKESSENADRGKRVELLFEPEKIGTVPGYKITYSEIDNQSRTATVLRGRLVDLGAVRILDTEFDKRELQSAFRGSAVEPHLRNVHFFTKVEVTDNTLGLSSLSNRWFMRAVLEEGAAFPCVFECDGDIDFCSVLLTGTPRMLREFLRKYGDQPKLFGGKGSTAWRREQ